MGYPVREMVWWVMAIIMFILLGFHGESEGCLKEEREALLKLKEAFNYPITGSSLPSWSNLTLSDCCTWEAVECDNSTNRVISLLLNDTRAYKLRHVKWSLNASSFLPFQQLQALYLSGNYLSGLFGDIRLTNLEQLDLRDNELTEVPSFVNVSNFAHPVVTSAEQTVCITATRNSFEGTFPSSLFYTLRSLEAIAVSDDYFIGSFSLSLLANHSNLKIFGIECSNANLKLESENPPFIPSFQLGIFIITNCTLNEANNNKMPTFLLHQYDLLELELSQMNISGTFPSWLLINNTKLNSFDLSHNLFIGPFELNSTLKLLQMQFFYISSNPIGNKIPSHIGFIFPNLVFLDMSSTSSQGSFPASIGEMRQLCELDFSNNNLSGYLPREFGHGNNKLTMLKLSSNNFSGPYLPIGSNFTYLLFLELSNNNFKGKFQGGVINSTELRMLDISSNQLFGEIPSWIGNFRHLSYLILSNNSLTGSLPESFCNLTKLTYLDLSQNKFNGSLPNCLNMPLLKYLHLQRNHFMGPLPSTLANSPLLTLDLMKNNFSGQVPRLLSSFLNLRVLILKENKLEGSIPVSFCELKEISILDLSQNKLSGTIPHCLNNITFGKRNGLRDIEIGKFSVSWTEMGLHYYLLNISTGEAVKGRDRKQDVTLYYDQEVDFTTKRRCESYKGNILNFMSGLDFSDNQLAGEIPSQIGYLITIHMLNLSNNHLKGPIPKTFSNLKQIESLDLSHNKLTGHIPTQLTQLYFLSVFSVAYNNLSGMTPDMKSQFSTFGSSSYEGNHFLCGLPLPQNCPSFDKSMEGKHKLPYHLEVDDFRDAFLWSFAGAFGISFLGVIIFLYFNYYFHNYKFERKLVRYLYGKK
ncbi:hypothetical protein K1719_016247 [Acacia pycnantha]|nr:hypothetical protein K1719_016247 [Acacia pycnantha]